jgi:hypothetical protein
MIFLVSLTSAELFLFFDAYCIILIDVGRLLLPFRVHDLLTLIEKRSKSWTIVLLQNADLIHNT